MTAEPALRRKTIALVGLMGVGKSSIGRRLCDGFLINTSPSPRDYAASRVPSLA